MLLSLAITKYNTVPLTAVGKNMLLAMLISSSSTELAYRFFYTSFDLIFDSSSVFISYMSSSTMPLD